MVLDVSKRKVLREGTVRRLAPDLVQHAADCSGTPDDRVRLEARWTPGSETGPCPQLGVADFVCNASFRDLRRSEHGRLGELLSALRADTGLFADQAPGAGPDTAGRGAPREHLASTLGALSVARVVGALPFPLPRARPIGQANRWLEL